MKLTKEEFKKINEKHSEKSPVLKNTIFSFLIGGTICLIAEIIRNILLVYFEADIVIMMLPVILIFISAFLTGIGVYDKIANVANCGTLIPITGFANAIVAPAIEFKSEGYVAGTAVKMFTVAGPVLVFGAGAAFIYGVIYYIGGLF